MPASTSPASTDPESPSGSGNDAGATLQLSAEKVAFSAATLEAKAGQVTIQFDNKDDGVPHNLHVTGNGIDEKTDVESGPVTQRLTLDAESGTFTFVCDVHPQQMTGDLVVT